MWVEVGVKRVRKRAFLLFLWGAQAEGFTASGMVFAAPGILPRLLEGPATSGWLLL